MVAFEGWLGFCPETANRGGRLLQPGEPRVGIDSQGVKLFGEPPDAYAEDHSPTGQDIERRQRASRDERMTQSEQEDGGAEPDARRRLRNHGENYERVVQASGPGIRERPILGAGILRGEL